MSICTKATCKSDRIISVSGKCADRFDAFIKGRLYEGYVPDDIGIGRYHGDFIILTFCLDCGQMQGDFPLATTKIENGQEGESISHEEMIETMLYTFVDELDDEDDYADVVEVDLVSDDDVDEDDDFADEPTVDETIAETETDIDDLSDLDKSDEQEVNNPDDDIDDSEDEGEDFGTDLDASSDEEEEASFEAEETSLDSVDVLYEEWSDDVFSEDIDDSRRPVDKNDEDLSDVKSDPIAALPADAAASIVSDSYSDEEEDGLAWLREEIKMVPYARYDF